MFFKLPLIKLLENMTCREIQNRTFREEVKISFNSQRPICGQMSGLAGAGNKTRNYQQQKQLQYLLDCTWYKIYISNKFMEIIFLIFLTKNHLCSTAWSKGNLVLLVNNFQRSIVFLPCPCVSPSIDPWVTEAWNQYIHAQLELDRSWWIFPSIMITDLSNDEHI